MVTERFRVQQRCAPTSNGLHPLHRETIIRIGSKYMIVIYLGRSLCIASAQRSPLSIAALMLLASVNSPAK